MSHGHSANNFMDTIANQPSEHQGAAVDVGSGPLFGVWVPVTERMPADRQRVLVAHLNGIHVWRAIAAYYPAGAMDASEWDAPPEDWWDEDLNRCVCPDAGWWEECFEVEGASMLSNVTHWMPLPASPNN